MKKYIICILTLLFIFNNNLHSQHFIAAKTFVKDNTVYIRFVPDNTFTLNSCKEKGVIIKRIAWDSNLLPDSASFRSAEGVIVKPFEKMNDNWIDLVNKKIEAGFLYNLLYESSTNTNTNNTMAFGLAMLSCDFDVELSQAAGLFYKDESLAQGRYAYLIQSAKGSKNIKPAIVLVNTFLNDKLQNIDSLKIQVRKKEVKLLWDIRQLKDDYAGYIIERSNDGESFSQLNQRPHIQVLTQYEKEKKDISFNDTITEYGKIYYYRIKGLGFFGVTGNYSNVVTCKLIKPLEAFPQVDSTQLIYDSILHVHWHMPDGFNLNELKGFDIYRNSDVEGGYKKINSDLLSENVRLFVDEKPNQSNYYKVLAYNIYGDSAFSHPILGLIPDIHPPKVPTGLEGKVDTLGNVNLSWLPNKETDLMGYRVFRNNSVSEELVEITKEIFNDTIYKDTITLETLTEEVYYSITAVDKVYNNSKFSATVKLKRPDKIKPIAVQFTEVIHNDSSIIVKWIPSSSKDVQQYELWCSIENAALQKVKVWAAGDTFFEFTDTNPEYGKYYQYQIKVMDDDGNFSVSNSALHYFDARVRKPVKKIDYKIDLEKKTITLNWEYPEKELYSFVIYKAKAGEPLKIIKTLKADVFTFEDADLYIGNQYEYCIKANYNSGSESRISDKILIDF